MASARRSQSQLTSVWCNRSGCVRCNSVTITSQKLRIRYGSKYVLADHPYPIRSPTVNSPYTTSASATSHPATSNRYLLENIGPQGPKWLTNPNPLCGRDLTLNIRYPAKRQRPHQPNIHSPVATAP